MPTRARSAIPTASGARRPSGSTGSSRRPSSRTPRYEYPERLDQMVRGRHAQRLRQLHRPAPRRRAATRSRSSGRATRPAPQEQITYRKLHERVCRCANVLKSLGVRKGDRVTIYLPMIPEAAFAMLACARIGAVHSVVFGGFSPDSLVGPHQRLRQPRGHHRRRGPPRRQDHPAQEERRRGAEECAGRREGAGRPQHRRRCRHEGRPRRLVARGRRRRRAVLRSRADERRGSAVHPLHLRLHRQAQGRAAHHRRLPASGPPTRTRRSSTTATARSTGAPPMSAGSPATATSSMARSPTARPR